VGLFPTPKEIALSCSCPDSARLCKHVAAVLYGIGSRFDQQPELLFRLHDVNHADLIATAGTGLPLSKTGPAKGKILADEDLSGIFGLEIDVDAGAKPKPPKKAAAKKAAPKKATKKRATLSRPSRAS
jgi:uncharacterized Zn finger protein